MRRLIPALCILVLAAPAVKAADLPSLPAPEPANWSFTMFGGASWLDGADTTINPDLDPDVVVFDAADFDFDTGFLIGGAMGFTLVDWARTEIEVAYAGYDLKSLTLSVSECGEACGPITDVEANVGVLTVMGNMWFGLNALPLLGDRGNLAGSGLGVTPYFGGGLGVGFVSNDGDDADAFLFADDSTGLAWQVGAGVRWTFVSNLGLDLGYRYRNVTNVGMGSWDDVNFASQNVTLGVVFNF